MDNQQINKIAMDKIIYGINHELSQKIIKKTFSSSDWYVGQLKKSAKWLRGWWYEQDYK